MCSSCRKAEQPLLKTIRRPSRPTECRSFPRQAQHGRPRADDRPFEGGTQFHRAAGRGAGLRNPGCRARQACGGRDPGSSDRRQRQCHRDDVARAGHVRPFTAPAAGRCSGLQPALETTAPSRSNVATGGAGLVDEVRMHLPDARRRMRRHDDFPVARPARRSAVVAQKRQSPQPDALCGVEGRQQVRLSHGLLIARIASVDRPSASTARAGASSQPILFEHAVSVATQAQSAVAGRPRRPGIGNRPTSTATACCASAALPPLPQTRSLPQPARTSATSAAIRAVAAELEKPGQLVEPRRRRDAHPIGTAGRHQDRSRHRTRQFPEGRLCPSATWSRVDSATTRT